MDSGSLQCDPFSHRTVAERGGKKAEQMPPFQLLVGGKVGVAYLIAAVDARQIEVDLAGDLPQEIDPGCWLWSRAEASPMVMCG